MRWQYAGVGRKSSSACGSKEGRQAGNGRLCVRREQERKVQESGRERKAA